MEQPVTATISEIATALGISRQAIQKRAKCWQSTGNRIQGGGETYDIGTIQLRAGEAKKIKRYLKRKTATPINHPSLEEARNEAAEAERQRIQARFEGQEIFNRMPEEKQRPANAKLAIITACNSYITSHRLAKKAGQDSFADEYNLGRSGVAPWVRDEIPSFHPGTLRNWISAEYELGKLGLVDQYGNRKGQSKIETYTTGIDPNGRPVQPLRTAILALIAKYPHMKPERIAEFLPEHLPAAPSVSAKSIARWIESYKREHPQEWAYIVNPDDWKNKHLTAAGEMDEQIRYIPNARWEIDATPADLLLTDGRNKIIGLIDVGTRRLILQVTPTEKGLDNAKVARRGILDWGVPAEGVFITDQGNPYKSQQFKNFLDGLDIDHEFCAAFSGDRKPFIERAFRTFSHDLVEQLPGYCGHSVAERKAIEARKTFAQRLMKKGEVIEAKITAAELQAFCDRWCANYHNRIHSTLGKSPNQVVGEWPHPIHRVQDERALDVLLSPVAGRDGWRKVGKKGVRTPLGWFNHAEFGVLSGKRVRVLETDDIGRVIINIKNEFDVMEFVCIAECPELLGISRGEVADATRERQKEVIAQVNELKKELKKEMKSVDVAATILARRERQAAESNVTYLPSRTIEHTTPGLTAARLAAITLDGRDVAVEHSSELQAKRAALSAAVSQPRPPAETPTPRPKVVPLRTQPAGFRVPEDRRERWLLWNELHQRVLAEDDTMLDDEIRFYTSFRKSPTWRSFNMLLQPAK